MKLTALKYSETEITERMAFPNGNPEKKLPIALLFFLVETAGRSILVDVGCDTMPGFPLYRFCPPVEVLECCGVPRGSITDVVLTHTHHDHIDALRYYPQAAIWLQQAELAAAQPYLPSSGRLHLFDAGAVICPNVEVRHIGGHSAGSSVLLLSVPQGEYVLCGDECYTRENLLKKIPTGSSLDPAKSTAFVETYSDARYRTVLFHDPDLVKEIGSRVLF